MTQTPPGIPAAPFEAQDPTILQIPKSLIPPIDMSRAKKEKDVKTKIKKLLNVYGWFTWMPAANGYGTSGVHDHLALKDGTFLTVEAKFGPGKPTPLQCSFAAQVIANNGFSFCVNEKNIDWLAYWLESFNLANHAALMALKAGKDPEGAVPDEHGSRLLNAVQVLTQPFGDVQTRTRHRG